MHEFELCVGDGTRSFADTETEKKNPTLKTTFHASSEEVRSGSRKCVDFTRNENNVDFSATFPFLVKTESKLKSVFKPI